MKLYLILFVLLVFFILLISTSFIDIPVPSKFFVEEFKFEDL